MTRKDYVLIAGAINKVYLTAAADVRPVVASVLAEMVETLSSHFERDNERFDRVRFKDAAFKQ